MSNLINTEGMNPVEASIRNLIAELFVKVVDEEPGIKGTKLIVELSKELHKAEVSFQSSLVSYESDKILSVLEELVSNKQLVEMGYVLPTMSYREKVLYFPKDTKILLRY